MPLENGKSIVWGWGKERTRRTFLRFKGEKGSNTRCEIKAGIRYAASQGDLGECHRESSLGLVRFGPRVQRGENHEKAQKPKEIFGG